MEDKTKIIIANAPIENGNRGCQALSITSMYLINKLFKDKGRKCMFFLPDSQCSDDGLHSFKIFDENIDFYACDYPYQTTIKGNIKNLLKFNKFKKNLDIFKEIDFILDIGQGDSFADIYGKNRFMYVDRIHRLAEKFGKPYCILPQTIGPFSDKNIRELANRSILKSAMVMARDKRSFDYVVKNVPEQKNIHEYIDVAFFMPYRQMKFNDDFIHVGLNISALLWNGGYTQNNQFGLTVDYKKTIRLIIDYFLSEDKVKLHLIPHVVGENRGIENDYEVSYDLWNEYQNERLVIAPFFLGPIEAKNYISGMDFFMGARMHSTIGAFSARVPVFPMAYSRKFNGLFEDTLNYPYMCDMKSQTDNEIIDGIKAAFLKREELMSIINDRMDGIVENRKQLFMNNIEKIFKL